MIMKKKVCFNYSGSMWSWIPFFGKSKRLREDFSTLSPDEIKERVLSGRENLLSDFKLEAVEGTLKELKGLKGLDNLGNTCYMNAALQCLSNTSELTTMLLKDDWINEINTVNSIGSRGKLLCAYAELLRKIWDGRKIESFRPKKFKNTVSEEFPQFEGYDQHDSQEFLSFLMDNLHEDMNTVLNKPYLELKDFTPGSDIDQYARLCIDNFHKRNASRMLDIFYGIYKSKIQCPDCHHVSITFDPFNMVSVPLKLQKKAFNLGLHFMDANTFYDMKKLANIPLFKGDTFADLRRLLKQLYPKEDYSNYRFYAFYKNEKISINPMELIPDEEKQGVWELDQEPTAYFFLVHDKFQGYFNPREETIQVNLAIKGNKDVYGITKPVILNSKYSRMKLYKLVFEFLRNSCTDTTRFQELNFEDYFGFIENPKAIGEWPFCIYNDKELIGDVYNGSLLLKEDCVLSIMLENKELKVAKNLKDSLSITSDDATRNKNYRNSTNTNIQECLLDFTTNERLDDENTWYCKECKDHKLAQKQILIYELPKILILHLKRFETTHSSMRKDIRQIDFPLEGLDLKDCLVRKEQNSIYDLYGVINHMGSIGGGHYTAYVHSPSFEDWVEFDDENVQKLDKEQIVSKAAYVLFYRRRDD